MSEHFDIETFSGDQYILKSGLCSNPIQFAVARTPQGQEVALRHPNSAEVYPYAPADMLGIPAVPVPTQEEFDALELAAADLLVACTKAQAELHYMS